MKFKIVEVQNFLADGRKASTHFIIKEKGWFVWKTLKKWIPTRGWVPHTFYKESQAKHHILHFAAPKTYTEVDVIHINYSK